MKKVNWEYLLIIIPFLVPLKSAGAEIGNAYLFSEKVSSGWLSVEDTTRFQAGKFEEEFAFVLKDKRINPETIYKIEGGELFFNTNQPGYFATKQKYKNYKLHCEWKWPEGTLNGNSGVLVHTQKPDSVWPKCIQIQLKQKRAGDLIAMNGAMFDEAAGKPKETAERFSESNEKENEWNECDIVCEGDSIIVYVNGVIKNRATHVNSTAGTIGFQLEGKPIYFRNIYLVKPQMVNGN